MALAVTINDNVEILTSEGETDPNTYTVEDIQKQLVVLRCQATDQPVKVHKSRISKIIKENMMEETVMSTATTTQAEEIASEVSEAMTESTSTTNESSKVNFDQLIEDGYEVWTKNSLNFDQGGFEVAAHCVISPDRTEYETFNTYNGSRGKNNGKMKKGAPKKRSVYALKDDKVLEKKRKTLARKGYIKRNDD